MEELLIKMTWDPEAAVWTAESVERVRFAVPELMELNGAAAAPLQLHGGRGNRCAVISPYTR